MSNASGQPNDQAARTGVILAAGFGSRLRGVSDTTELKPLTPVGGVPLLVRAIDSLALAGCAKVVIVVGHGAADVEGSLRAVYTGDTPIVFALNERFDLKNGVSVLASRPHLLGEEFVLMMADHVVGTEVMDLVRDYTLPPRCATLLVDPKLDTIFDMDDATKVYAEDGKIIRIGKTIEGYNCVDCGIFVCSTALMDAIDSVYQATGDASLSDGVQAFSADGRMLTLDVGDGFWQDIDTPEMLAHAEAVLLKRG